MKKKGSFDWSTELKEVPVREWEDRFTWVEEPYVSVDGETIASIVNVEEAVFTVCENGEIWENEYEKAWNLRPLPTGEFAACVARDEEWTLSIGGKEWENWFDFIWDLQINKDGSSLSLAVQKDSEYGMAVNDKPWEKMYANINEMVLSDQGNTAAVVQVTSMGQADIEVFKQGIFSCAVNGKAMDKNFLNIWDISFDSSAENVAYGVRLDRTNYTIVVNDMAWETKFQSVWKPEFLLGEKTVIAPVKTAGKWMLYKDDQPFWVNKYNQIWRVKVSPKADKIAAIASKEFGKWTVVENDETWNMTADLMISDLIYSKDGSTLVAILKDQGTWTLAVDQKKWNLGADKVFNPCISDDGSIVCVVIERKGQYFLVVNNRVIPTGYDFMATPVISSDNTKIIQKAVKDGVYQRRILSMDKIL
jgi:hypothetical protein